MSKTTSSPLPISRSPGSACGSAPLGPAATIAGNEGSPPSSRTRASKARATARSVLPASPCSVLQRRASSASFAAASISASSSASLTRPRSSHRPPAAPFLPPPQPLDPAAGGDHLDAVGEFFLQFLQQPHRHLVVLEADPPLQV